MLTVEYKISLVVPAAGEHIEAAGTVVTVNGRGVGGVRVKHVNSVVLLPIARRRAAAASVLPSAQVRPREATGMVTRTRATGPALAVAALVAAGMLLLLFV